MEQNPAQPSTHIIPRGAPRVAIVGAGVAGSACAAGLAGSGCEVTVFDKSRGVGGRMATRRALIGTGDGTPLAAQFDHGCGHFSASRPRFRAVVEAAVAAGRAARWQQRVYARFPALRVQEVVVPVPDMPAFCRHLLGGVRLRLGRAVTRLHRGADGWWLRLDDDAVDGDPGVVSGEGPFDQVILALPAAQAGPLLQSHRPDWAETLSDVDQQPCWTLMAVTDEVDWPWDAAEIEQGELAWIGREDRKPGRAGVGPGQAAWVAHADAAWSRAHLEDEPEDVCEQLRAALARLLPGGRPGQWHHAMVHRWRYARPTQAVPGGVDCWWDAGIGLGVCGDAFGEGSVQSAWSSGDELADTLAASFETSVGADAANVYRPVATPHRPTSPRHPDAVASVVQMPARAQPTATIAVRSAPMAGSGAVHARVREA